MTPDGTRQWRIAPRAAAALDWSPDGQRLVYAASDRGSGDVFVVNANGSGKRRLVRDASGSLKWSPRNDAIALSGTVGGREGLFVVRPDGRHLRKVSSSYSIYGGAPAWSPDGTRLAIVARAPELNPNVTGYGSASVVDLYVVEVASGRARRITEGWRYNYANRLPQWHPRGLRTDRLGGTRVSQGVPTDSVVTGETLRARRPIERLVAEGSSVVLHYPWDGASDCLESWDPLVPSVVRYLPGRCDLVDLGLAGSRMAWVIYDGGSHGSALATMTTDLAVPAIISGICDPYLPGPPIPCYRLPMFDLLGDGPLLVFDTWDVNCNDWVNCLSTAKVAGRLWRLEGSHAVQIASSAGGLTPLSVDDGRILVDHGAGELEVVAADGTSLRTFHLDAALLRGARLQGRDLVVLTPGAVEVSDAETGEFVGRWPSPSEGARLVDVQGQIAVLMVGRELHLVRLSDGQTAGIRPPGTGPVLAQLEPAGLFYSYRADDPSYPGRVEFVSQDKLGALFG